LNGWNLFPYPSNNAAHAEEALEDAISEGIETARCKPEKDE
jgi:hypothetical protein